MSHRATSWAFQQRGLPPAARVVLLYLADRHNPDHGCFPSQAQLAADCEMSISSLNNQLELLERRDLIRRERRVDPATRQRKSTRYILGFEMGEPQEPSPESGHGNGPKPSPKNGESHLQNLETNLVREPVSTTARAQAPARGEPLAELQARCLAACGPGLCAADRETISRTSGVIEEWIEEGFDLEADILPIIHRRTDHQRLTPIRTWDYFTDAIRAAHRRRLAAEQAGRARAQPPPEAAKAAGDRDVAAWYAEWINSDKYLPASAVSNRMRNELLARGLVTPERLRERGVP